jgi:DNA-binding SARP family transcriptional activator
MADKGTKVHVLNNMALCYQRIKKTDEALKMLDQVVEIDEFNSKAWQRKLTYLQESGKKD